MTLSQYLKDHATELDKEAATIGRVENVLALLHDYLKQRENAHAQLVLNAQFDLLELHDRLRSQTEDLRGIVYSATNDELSDLDLPGDLEGRDA